MFHGHTHKKETERAVRFYSKWGWEVNCLTSAQFALQTFARAWYPTIPSNNPLLITN